MFIKELSDLTGVNVKAIRYYEDAGLMVPPQRAANNYRVYTTEAVERLRFIVAARSLSFSIADIAEFLAARDEGQLPCHSVLESLAQRVQDIDRRISDLLALRDTLNGIQREAANLPPDKECDEACICYLLTVNQENGQVTIQKEAQSADKIE